MLHLFALTEVYQRVGWGTCLLEQEADDDDDDDDDFDRIKEYIG